MGNRPQQNLFLLRWRLSNRPPALMAAWRPRPSVCVTKTISSSWHRQPSLVCGRTPVDPHHLRFVQPQALRKVSDEFAVRVWRLHHRELHRHGDEAAWWKGMNIDPMPIALGLWYQTGR
jgi:hypothetical protein